MKLREPHNLPQINKQHIWKILQEKGLSANVLQIFSHYSQISKNFIETIQFQRQKLKLCIERIREDINISLRQLSSWIQNHFQRRYQQFMVKLDQIAEKGNTVQKNVFFNSLEEKNQFCENRFKNIKNYQIIIKQTIKSLNNLAQDLQIRIQQYKTPLLQDRYRKDIQNLATQFNSGVRTIINFKNIYSSKNQTSAEFQPKLIINTNSPIYNQKVKSFSLANSQNSDHDFSSKSLIIEKTGKLMFYQPYTFGLNGSKAKCMTQINDQLIAIGTQEGAIDIYKIPQGFKIAALNVSKKAVSSLSNIQLGKAKLLASASEQNSNIFIWDPTDWSLLSQIQAHCGAITSLLDLKDTRSLASSSKDNTIKIHDLQNQGKLLFDLFVEKETPKDLILTSKGDRLISCGAVFSLHIWSIVRGQKYIQSFRLQRVIRNDTLITTVVGSYLLSQNLALGTEDGKLKLVNLSKGEAYKTLSVSVNALTDILLIQSKENPEFPTILCSQQNQSQIQIIQMESGRSKKFQSLDGIKTSYIQSQNKKVVLFQGKERVMVFKVKY